MMKITVDIDNEAVEEIIRVGLKDALKTLKSNIKKYGPEWGDEKYVKAIKTCIEYWTES